MVVAQIRRRLTVALDLRALALSRIATGIVSIAAAVELYDARAVVLDEDGPSHPVPSLPRRPEQ